MCENKCVGCEVEDKAIPMFKLTFYDEEFNGEIYCNECLANILIEEPDIVVDVEAI